MVVLLRLNAHRALCCTYSEKHKWRPLCISLRILYTATLFCLLLLRAVMPPPLLFVTALYSRWISQQGTHISGAFSQGLQQRTGTHARKHTHTEPFTTAESMTQIKDSKIMATLCVREREKEESASDWKHALELICLRSSLLVERQRSAHCPMAWQRPVCQVWSEGSSLPERPGLMTQPSQWSFTLHQFDVSDSLLDDEKTRRQATLD